MPVRPRESHAQEIIFQQMKHLVIYERYRFRANRSTH